MITKENIKRYNKGTKNLKFRLYRKYIGDEFDPMGRTHYISIEQKINGDRYSSGVEKIAPSSLKGMIKKALKETDHCKRLYEAGLL